METERLILRPWALADVDALHRLWTDAQVRRWLWDDVTITRDGAEAVVRACVRSAEESGIGMWCVLPRGGDSVIGFCGFRFVDDTRDVEILYGFLPAFWGQGLATEAGWAVLDYGFGAGLFERVYGRTDVPNRASIKVLEKLGMRFEKQILVGDLPTLCYSLAKPE